MNLLPLLLASSILALARSVAAAPGVNTLAATSLSGTGATLNGTVNANDSSTAVSFEYGLSVAYGSTITAAPTPVTGSSPTAVSAVLTGLTPGTVYHFRTSGTSTGGTGTGGDLLLATSLPNVAAVFNAATDVPVTAAAVTAAGATVNFTLNFAPVTGTELMVVKNTGLSFINGTFSNLTQGQTVTLSYGGINYQFVANYYGGTGNDLVLVWKANRAVAWGYNGNGELGNNSTSTASGTVPVAVNSSGVLSGKTTLAVAAGVGYSLALCSDGSLASWGFNGAGQLGNNSTTQSAVPVAVNASGVLSGKTVIAISAGYDHSLALCADGTVAAWGNNSAGQLGNNSTTPSSVPVAVNLPGVLSGKTVIAVAAGISYSLALCSDGTVAGWGRNDYAQLGSPMGVNTTGILSGKTVIAIVAGGYHSLALCSDGTLATWGSNTYGTLGPNSNAAASFLPVAVNTTGVLSGKTVTVVAAGLYHNLALCNDGTVAAWGYNGSGQLGYSTPSYSNPDFSSKVPKASNTSGLLFGKTIIAVTAGCCQSLALCSDGTVGTLNSAGAVEVNTNSFATGERFIQINSGTWASHTLAVVASPQTPSITTLGATSISRTGATLNGTVTPKENSTTVAFEFGPTTAYGSTVATTPTLLPVGLSTAVNSVLSGLSPGTVYHYRVSVTSTAGTNSGRDMVFATALPDLAAIYNSAADVPLTAEAVTAAGASVNFTLNYAPATGTELMVVKNAGLSFINGTFSNLAQGQTVTLSYGGGNYDFVANYYGGTGNDLVLVWKSQRCLAWGYNYYGQLGNNTLTQRTVPTAVNSSGVLSGKTVLKMATGKGHSLALCSDGTLASWGDNYNGELGNRTDSSTSTVPVTVDTSGVLAGKTVISVAAGDEHSLALCADGTIAAWGNGFYYGQLGNGIDRTRTFPVAVDLSGALAGKTVIAVAAGGAHSLVLCSDGTVAAWGYNGYGSLGSYTPSDHSNVPKLVNPLGALAGKNVIALAGGGEHSLALCSDGTVAAWGYNGYGQLGNNSTTNSQVPVAVDRSGVLAGKTVIAVAAGVQYSLALCADGTLATWGYNNAGQLGNNSTANSQVPVAVDRSGVLLGKSIVAISAGVAYSLALCTDGTVAAWGYNGNDQLGNNSLTNSHVPVAVNTSPLAPGERFIQVQSGSAANHSLALVSVPPPLPPAVTTLSATSIASTGVTLNSTVTANGPSTAVSFDYGLTTAYGSSLAGTPASVTGRVPTIISATLTGLTPGTVYHYRINGVNSAGTASGTDLTFTTPIAQSAVQQAWRQSYFGTTGNTGNAADNADSDHDGLPNLIEWACHLDPTARSPQPYTAQCNGATFEFTYTRSVVAMNAGAVFTVEWSDTLLSNSWSSSSVTEQTLSDNGTEQQVKASVPIDSAGHRFAHLRVTGP